MDNFYIVPDIQGIKCAYDSIKQIVIVNDTTFHLSLGSKTYLPIIGFLYINKIELEKINFTRYQNHLPLFKTSREAILNALEEQDSNLIKIIKFVALGLASTNTLIIEDYLLAKLGYHLLPKSSFKCLEDTKSYINTIKDNQAEYLNFLGEWSTIFNGVFLYKELDCIEKIDLVGKTCARKIQSCKSSISHIGKINFDYSYASIRFNNQIYNHLVSDFYFENEISLYLENGIFKPDLKHANVCKTCSFCNHDILHFNGFDNRQYNYCLNNNCKEKVIKKALFYTQKDCLNIKGLSYETLNKIYDYLIALKDTVLPFDLFNVTEDDIKKIILNPKQAELLFESLQRSRKQGLGIYINALCIPLLTLKKAKKIAQIYDNNFDAFISDLKACNGDKIKELIDIQLLTEKMEIIEQFYNFSRFTLS